MQNNRIIKIFWYLQVIPKLGIRNVLYVFYYRLKLRLGIVEKKCPIHNIQMSEPVFKNDLSDPKMMDSQWRKNLIRQADDIIKGRIPYYSYHWMKQTSPPNWFKNIFNGKESKWRDKHWSKIADFSPDLGDIKNVWELSRFSWLGILARGYAATREVKYINTLNDWLADWIKKNPVNQGLNWKCGQEASFRVFNLLNAAYVLKQEDHPSALLVQIVDAHLQRINVNVRYALAQQNNHATSESAALFIGGSWLLKVKESHKPEWIKYAQRGRNLLERLSGTLTYKDGSFAQHSVIYHRLFLDTMTTVLFWCKRLTLPEFSPKYYKNLERSMNWLISVMDESGVCPNFGPNDGTMLLSNHSCDYRDCRPSVQTASVLINNRMLFEKGAYNEPLYWMDIQTEEINIKSFSRKDQVFTSGYVIMIDKDSWAFLRFPNYKFRPSHNDVLHFDLWSKGNNILFDSGSYSYYPDKGSMVPDLKSVKAHNTLSFDGEEQMPRLGRFLMAKWINPQVVGEIGVSRDGEKSWAGSYKDSNGNKHERRIDWKDNEWRISDIFSGKSSNIEIGFNFEDCQYSIDQNTLLLPWGKISVSDNAKISVKKHQISNYYFQLSYAYRLKLSAVNNDTVTTLIQIF